jgi:hypothetical protein
MSTKHTPAELKPTRYEFTSPTWCGGSLSADREEDPDGEYVKLEDVQAAIAAWNRRAAAPVEVPVPAQAGMHGWISVEDRMPEGGDDVVSCLVVHSAVDGPDVRIDCWADGGWYQHNENLEHFEVVGGCCPSSRPKPPTHWMPLPPPPEQEQK